MLVDVARNFCEALSLGAAVAKSGAVSAELAATVEILAGDPTAHLSLWLLCVGPGGRCRWRDALVSQMTAAGLLPAGASDVYTNPDDMAVLWGDRGDCARADNADVSGIADFADSVDVSGSVGPGQHCSPRHRMRVPFNSDRRRGFKVRVDDVAINSNNIPPPGPTARSLSTCNRAA